MFLHDKKSLFKDQKNIRPKIEDIAFEYVNEEFKEDILEFITYLKEDKMTVQWASVNSWKILHKSKDVAFIKLYEGSWYIDPAVDFKDSNFESLIKKEKYEKIIWDNIEICVNCLPNGQCTPGRSVKILGKDYKNVCHSIRFKNPKINEINCIKKIFEYRKKIISENGVSKTFYVGKKRKEELIKKYGLENYNLGYEAIMLYINQKMDNKFDSFIKIYEKIKEKNPKINFLELFEIGLEEYSK